MFQFARVASGLPGELGAVVVVDGPERAHHRQVVRASADVLEPIADHEAGLAVGLVAGLQRHDDLAVAVGRVRADDVFALGREHAGVRRLGDRFAGVPGELRLHVEAFDVAHAAAEEDPDDRLRPRREMRRTGGRLPRRRCGIGPGTVAEQHRTEREPGETHAGVGEERAAGDAVAIGLASRIHVFQVTMTWTEPFWKSWMWSRLSRVTRRPPAWRAVSTGGTAPDG